MNIRRRRVAYLWYTLFLIISLYSDGEEVALQDNINDIFYMLRYEADLLFTRSVRVREPV